MDHTLFKRLIRDRSGNFGIMTAALLPVLMGVAGVAMDFSNAVQMKNSLQGLSDAAALAAASSMAAKNLNKADAETLAKDYLAAQIGNYVEDDNDPTTPDAAKAVRDNTSVGVTESGTTTTGKTFNITVNSSYDVQLNPISRLFGFSNIHVAVSSSAMSSTEAKNALSMYLVLDRSGSMDDVTNTRVNGCTGNAAKCFVKKIDALKIATDSLLDTIKDADPDQKYARLGAVSYNNVMQTATVLDWGTTKVHDYVQALKASGTTNSGEAMETAYNSLAKTSEATEHQNKNGQKKPSKYIIFMTDGENNVSGADTKTKTACASAKTAGIEVYTVAFMAPSAGQKLLSACATDNSHYYNADDAVQLIAAFKAIGEKASQTATRLTN